jgi:hypothetical protein
MRGGFSWVLQANFGNAIPDLAMDSFFNTSIFLNN